MKGKTIVETVREEAKLIQGEKTKEVTYSSSNTFSNEEKAREAFEQSVGKLLNVNNWSTLSQFTANFILHDSSGELKPAGPVAMGDFIRIELPGPLPENWVSVIHQEVQTDRAEFTVQPCSDPNERTSEQTAHFFTHSARSTFRVERIGTTLHACELGSNERINNKGEEAAGRSLVNTLIAETAWLFYQKIQWQLLTDYLVHR